MNDFIQIEEYLTRKLKENCDEFDKFVRIEISRVNGSTQLSKNYIRYVYQTASENVENGFDTDCDNLSDWYGNLQSGIVSPIYNRGLEKIGTFTDYKLSLVLNKYEEYQANNIIVDKYTFLEWLSGDEL